MSIERSAKHENAVLIFPPRNACPLAKFPLYISPKITTTPIEVKHEILWH